MCGWGAGVPGCFVGGEVGPEGRGEAGGDYDGAAGIEGGEGGGEEAVDVENGDYEDSAVSGGEVVGCADVGWRMVRRDWGGVGFWGGPTYSLRREDFGV